MNFRSINLLLFVLILGNFDKVISNDNKDITRKYFEEWQVKFKYRKFILKILNQKSLISAQIQHIFPK